MKLHLSLSNSLEFKKGRRVSLLPFFIIISFLVLSSCASDPGNDGRVTITSGVDRKSFVFLINDDFSERNANSKPDKQHPKLTKAEAKLLYNLLNQKNYCVNEEGDTLFKINSVQDKIYDATFAHLIEQNYKARPIVPKTYFGQCVESEEELKRKY